MKTARQLYLKLVECFSFGKEEHGLRQCLRDLTHMTNYFKGDLLSPLKTREKRNEDRNLVMQSKVQFQGTYPQLDDNTKKIILSLSDGYDINEIDATTIVLSAQRHYPIAYASNSYQVAKNYFFEEREYMVMTLLTLLQGRQDQRIHRDLLLFIQTFTNTLISESLIANLSRLIQVLNHRLSIERFSNEELFIIERQKVAECLFYACYGLDMNTEEMEDVFVTIRHSLHNLSASPKLSGQRTQLQANGTPLKKVLFILGLTLTHAFNAYEQKIDRSGNEVKSCLYDTEFKFVKKFTQNLEEIGKAQAFNSKFIESFQGFLYFGWIISLQYCSDNFGENEFLVDSMHTSFKKVLQSKTFNFISTDFLTSDLFVNSKNSKNTHFYVSILSDIVRNVLEHMTKINEMVAEQEKSIKIGYLHQQSSHHSEDFLQMLADVFKLRPSFAHPFFNQSAFPNSNHFLFHYIPSFISEISEQSEIHPSFNNYLELLSSFAKDPQCAYSIYISLRDYSHAMFSWDNFFQILRKPKVDSKQLSKRFQHILFSILTLIENVARHSDESRSILLKTPKWDILEALFSLCQVSNLNIELMGKILSCIAPFVDGPEIALKVFERLNQIQTLNSTDSLSHGIRFQFTTIESREKYYYETIGFLKLMFQIIQHLIRSPYSRQQVKLKPYLNFVQSQVFQDYDNLEYLEKEQKWTILAKCLEIFHCLLSNYSVQSEDFDVSSTQSHGEPHPGYGFLSSVLNSEKPRLIEQLRKIFSPSSDPPSSNYKYCLLLTLKTFVEIYSKHDAYRRFSLTKQKKNPQMLHEANQLLDLQHLLFLPQLMSTKYSNEVCFWTVRLLSLVSKYETNISEIFRTRQKHDELFSYFTNRLRYISPDQKPERDVRSEIIRLLINNVDAPTPNLTHFLCGIEQVKLGYRIRKNANSLNCLYIILKHILSEETVRTVHPSLAELSYSFLFKLASDRRVSSVVLNFLDVYGFFSLQNLKKSNLIQNQTIEALHQRAYIMKLFALQLFVNTGKHQKKNRGSVRKLVTLLFGSGQSGPLDSGSFRSMEQHRTQILELLDTIRLHPETKYSIRTELFKDDFFKSSLDGTINIVDNAKFYDLNQLHSNLLIKKSQFMKSRSNIGASDVNLDNEIELILRDAVKRNEFSHHCIAIFNAFDGWKQLVDIVLSRCYEMIPDEDRQRIIYELIRNLLHKMGNRDIAAVLKTKIAETILRLMAKLREETMTLNQPMLPSDQCLIILHGLLSCILTEGTEAPTRGNLYGSLINFIQYVQGSHSHVIQDEKLNLDISRLLSTRIKPLVERIRTDALDQRNIWKTLSFATLDQLFQYDKNLVKYCSFDQFCDQLVLLKDGLLKVVQQNQVSLNPMYIFESIMSFFIRMTQIPGSSENFSFDAILLFLNNDCKWIDCIPTTQGMMTDEMDDVQSSTFQSLQSRYHHLLLPVLRLIASIFQTHSKNVIIAEKVLQFIHKHHRAITAIFNGPLSNIHVLEEQKLVSGIFFLLADHPDLSQKILHRYHSKYAKLQLHLLNAVLSIYQPQNFSMIKQLQRGEEVKILVAEISSNIIACCRKTMESSPFRNLILFTSQVNVNENEFFEANSLTLICRVLSVNVSKFIEIHSECRTLEQKSHQIYQLGTEELISILNTRFPKSQSKQKIQASAEKIFRTKIEQQRKQVNAHRCIIEHSLFILWEHLSYYLKDGKKLSITTKEQQAMIRNTKQLIGSSLDKLIRQGDRHKSDYIRLMSGKIDWLLESGASNSK